MRISSNLFVSSLHCSVLAPPPSIVALHTLPCLYVPFHAWSPEIRHHAKQRFTPHHRVPVPGEESKPGDGTGGERAPSEAASECSDASARSGRIAGGRSEASSGAGLGQGAGREVILPMPSRKDLGRAHLDPPLDRVTLAAEQPDPA